MEKAMACAATGMVLAMALSPSLPARAAVTNVVDVDALIAAVDAGLSETNGWTMSGLGKYAKGADYASNPACVKFDTKGDWLESPDYGAHILGVELVVRCSATDSATRFLHFRDMDGADAAVVATCLQANRCESKSLPFPGNADLSQFRIVLDGSGNAGVWGIGALSVLTAEPAVAPAGLRVSRMGDDWCALSWANGAGTVSNRVDAYKVERGKGEDVIFETGFNGFDRAAVGNKDLSEQLATLLGDAAVSGERVYAADGTNGVCQIGTTANKGFLRYSGVSDWSDVELRLVMKKHDYAGDANELQIAWETDVATNRFKTIDISAEFAEYVVELSSAQPPIPANASIVIGYYSGVGGNRRVLIDSLSIVRTGAVALAPLGSRWLPASPGPVSFSTKGAFALPERAECRFDVFARNADGLLSAASTVETRLGGVPGFRFILR